MNNVVCKLCGNEFNSNRALSCHLSKNPACKIKLPDYYNKFLKEKSNGGICYCGKSTTFVSLTKGYLEYCSSICSGNNPNVKNKQKNTNLSRYGYISPAQNIKIKNKQKNTNLSRYGYVSPAQNLIIQNKSKKTCLDKYNVEYTSKSKEMQGKSKKTKLDRYGDEYYNNIEKNKATCINKYGVDNAFKLQSTRDKNKLFLANKVYNKILNNPSFASIIEPLFDFEKYIGAKAKYLFKCKQCNSSFYDNLNNGNIPRCIHCYPINKAMSLGEKEISNFIKNELNLTVIENDRKILNGFEIDIYVPSKKIAIEYNGNYWHSELISKNKLSLFEKTKLADSAGIKLIHIFEDEWYNNQDIVKSRLKSIFGINDVILYARSCKIKEIVSKLKGEFLENNHLQGNDKSNISIGAYCDDVLVSVMTFGSERIALGNKNNKTNTYELYRYCTRRGHNIVGIFNKLIKYAIENYNIFKIISYADRRWSCGVDNVYLNNGFSLLHATNPNYWYMKRSHYLHREHRYNYRKNVLLKKLQSFDANLTEWQNMQINGYDRIWDCGSYKYELIV